MTDRARQPAVVDVLAAAGISSERMGPSRAAGLSAEERSLYRWVLRAFADGRPPDLEALAAESARRELKLDQAVEAFRRDDLVHLDAGKVVVAYPFSGRSTPHRVRIDGCEVFAMCAIDALGIAPMLGVPVEITSADPTDGSPVRVALSPDGRASWRPQEAVVLAGRACEGPAFSGCCEVLNFFARQENAERYLREHPEVRGFPISIPEAIQAGRLVFGDALKED